LHAQEIKSNVKSKDDFKIDLNAAIERVNGKQKTEQSQPNKNETSSGHQKLTPGQVDYKEFSKKIKAKYPEYKDVDNLVLAKKMVEKYPEYRDKVIFNQPVKSMVRSFKAKGKIYDIPIDKVKLFLIDMPEAKEVKSFLVGKDTLNIPIDRVTDFLKYIPEKKLTPSIQNGRNLIVINESIYNLWLHATHEGRMKLLYYFILAKNPQLNNFGYEVYVSDMKNEENLSKLYISLSKRHSEWLTLGYESFKNEMFPEESIKELRIKKGNNRNFKLYNHLIDSKRITIDELGDFETFNTMLSDQSKAIKLHKNLIKKGFTEDEIGNQADFLANIEQVSATPLPNTSFQNDKIKVGDTFIDLPIPNGFVKVDNHMGVLLESAKKLCPETNTLLAYYISEADYGNFLVDQFYPIEKYLLIESFNEIRYNSVSNKDYSKFLNSFKNKYIEEFKETLNNAGIMASENISELDENLKMENIRVQPFGICYESNNSISNGILSKYNFTVKNESSEEYIVAVISTITKIQDKPIFLYVYKTYNCREDISSICAINTAWLMEIDKRQSPINLLTDFDYKNYIEIIIAILSLSLIWAIYFATKKIHKKMKNKTVSEKIDPKVEPIEIVPEKEETKIDFLDFRSYLKETEVKPEVSKKNISTPESPVYSPKALYKSKYINPIQRKLIYNSRKGILIFCVINFIFEVAMENKNMIWPVVVNYLISDWYIRNEIKKNKVYKNQWLHGIVVASIVFVIRVLFGAILSIIVEMNGGK
jgi:hypothetical protein